MEKESKIILKEELEALSKQAYESAKNKGFYPKDVNTAFLLMFIIVEMANSRQPCASGCGFPCALCIPALSPGFYGGTAPPGVAEYVNNGGKHHAVCETCHSER